MGGQSGTGKEILSSALPVLEGLSKSSGPAIGGYSTKFRVKNVPPSPVPAGIEIKCTIGGNECTNLQVLDNGNEIQCVVPAGGGSEAHAVVTVAGQSSTNAVFFAYDTPVVDRVEPETSAIAGGTTITVYGSNFGPYDGVTRRDGSVENLSILIGTDTGTIPCKKIERVGADDPQLADSQVICVTDANERSACRSVVASLAEQESTPKDILSFRDEPLIPREVDGTTIMDYLHDKESLLVVCESKEGCYGSDLEAAFQCTDPDLKIGVVYEDDLRQTMMAHFPTIKKQNGVLFIHGFDHVNANAEEGKIESAFSVFESSNEEDSESDIENWVREKLRHISSEKARREAESNQDSNT